MIGRDAAPTRTVWRERDGRRFRIGAALASAVAAVSLLAGCGHAPADHGFVGQDPAGGVQRIAGSANGFESKSSGGVEYRYGRLPAGSAATTGQPRSAAAPGSKLHPRLVPLITGGPPDSLLQLIVTFRDSVALPDFPRFNTNASRNSPGNLALLAQVDSLIKVVRGLRAQRYGTDSTKLVALPDLVVRGRFWLIQALVVDARVNQLLAIDSLSNVTYIRPVNAGEPPPTPTCPGAPHCPDTDPTNDLAVAIDKIGLTGWKSSGYDKGWIGVLDTGVYTAHDLLSGPFATGKSFFDCVSDCPTDCKSDYTTCTDCGPGNPGDLCEEGHGTATAGILVGHNSSLPQYEGMTAATLDWFSVYKQSDCSGDCAGSPASLDACAAIRAFEQSMHHGNPVILAMVAVDADPDDDRDPIARAAARAFEKDKVVIAPAGNGPRGDPVQVPASEATVFAVGGRYLYDWHEAAQGPPQRYGMVHGRTKPEILAPTKTEAPARCFNQAMTLYTATSGAAPYIGGTASILNSWIASTAQRFDPGHTYAQLILSGSLTKLFPSANANEGVGLLHVPSMTTTTTWLDKVYLAAGETAFIPLPGATDDIKTVVGALWWPEKQRVNLSRPHHQVKLELLDAHDNPIETSNDPNSVFQRVSAERSRLGDLTAWVLLWRGFDWCLRPIPSIGFRGWCFHLRFPLFVKRGWRLKITETSAMDPGEVQTVYWTAAGLR